jgi:hypothetical protein
MGPYIEDCGLWEDFHGALIHEIKLALARAAPERYLVRTGERSYLVLVETEGKNSHPFLTLRAFIEEEHREAFVEIYEAEPEQRLVTCIEVLSPSNKRPGTPGWDLYQRKRQSLMLGNVNLVEIDLLRRGQRMPMLDPWPDSPYVLMVAKAKKAQLCQAWRAHFRRPLPTIPVPLAKPDPPVSLSLQPLIEEIYQSSRYQQSIDYTKPLAAPLTAEDADWLQQQLRAQTFPPALDERSRSSPRRLSPGTARGRAARGCQCGQRPSASALATVAVARPGAVPGSLCGRARGAAALEAGSRGPP